MTLYTKRPEFFEAITFDEFVDYGLAHTTNIHGDMPWSFEYRGFPITHENDDCYLVPSLSGPSQRFERGDLLITSSHGQIFTCRPRVFWSD